MITKRDEKCIEFVKQFKCAKTSTLAELFYPSLMVARKRLSMMNKQNVLNREKLLYLEYVYFIKRSNQFKHHMLLADFYCQLNKVAEIHNFAVEPIFDNIRPDALVLFTIKGTNKKQLALVEIELSNKGANIGKYELMKSDGSYKNWFPLFPKIIFVTDKKVPDSSLDVKIIATDFSNINILTTG
jgi:hypothetical protein